VKTLSSLHLVQFSFWDYETFNLRRGGTAFLGPNGAGKTSLADAVQIALVGAHGNHMHFNAQSVHRDHRSVRDYALGTMRSGEGDQGVLARKRDEALSYITLIFEGESSADVISVGVCLHSVATDKSHRTLGLYILPGIRLALEDHLGALDDGGKAPLDWPTFEALARRLAKQAGRTPTLTAKPETYLNELLHVLQHKGRAIDKDKFLRALAQSLRLKGIQSVNDYLRGYLVDAQPIDKQGTLKHIKTVRSLVKQIEEVKEQIARLTDIDKRFNSVAAQYRTRAVASAVRLLLQVESADQRVGDFLLREKDLLSEIDAFAKSIAEGTRRLEAAREEHQKLLADYNADPASQNPEHARQLRAALQNNVTTCRRAVERLVLEVRDALASVHSISRAYDVASLSSLLEIGRLVSKWESRARAGTLPDFDAFGEALAALSAVGGDISGVREQLEERAALAARRLASVTEQAKAADKGIRLTDSGDVAAAMAMFRSAGIESVTVGSVVSVKDLSWQSAIESFLGRNRHALVVSYGREREAVRLLRTAPRPLFEVTIVQPSHIRDDLKRTYDATTVASLVESSNNIARTYLRRLLGQMRQVDTEEELERHECALTRDGMLSANGGTRRIRLVPSSEWVLGARISSGELEALRAEVLDATRADGEAKNGVRLANEAANRVTSVLRDVTPERIRVSIEELQDAHRSLDGTPDPTTIDLPSHLVELKRRLDDAKRAADDFERDLRKLSEELGTKRGALEATRTDLGKAQRDLTDLQTRYAAAARDVDYDVEAATNAYDKAREVDSAEGPVAALMFLETETKRANDRIVRSESDAKADFAAFINEMSINLVEERSDWRKAAAWVRNHIQKLTASTLVEYEQEAKAAREAANQSFRADVAYRMREAIKRVEHDIDDLNRILRGCPEFTGGEKYRFVAAPALAHKALYELIQSSAFLESGASPLFEAADDVQKKLVLFLEACETGADKANNPLEDYRLLFNFDLEIRVGDKKVDSLSKRLGVGSNGEHLVPFYVIAGASLANAYRLKAGESHEGAAVMIIDEAFHGFDAQNAYVTAQFLRSLGLQLVMAAPDADVGKLVPILDSYYDLDRFGSDVFTSEVIVKEDARRLLETDMPSRNPQLVEQMAVKFASPA
jgi:chromosome segregation protein